MLNSNKPRKETGASRDVHKNTPTQGQISPKKAKKLAQPNAESLDNDWRRELEEALDGLNSQQTRFVMEYVKQCKAAPAYRAAYGDHLSEGTCAVNGHKLLRITKVRRAIRMVSNSVFREFKTDPDFILQELAKMAYHANMDNFMEIQDDGNAVVDLSLVDRHMATAIKKLHTEEILLPLGCYGATEDDGKEPRRVRKTIIELVDRRAVLMDLAKLHKMFSDNFSPRAETAKIMQELRAGEIDTMEAAYRFTELGLPLPEVIKIQLTKGIGEGDGEEERGQLTDEELDQRFREAMASIQAQQTTFLPERHKQVLALKEDLKAQDSFAQSAG
ncbi:terminase small subunit [Geomonas sp. Red69]|uniref:terminase small subunit n=1 Tax=Geomonas diazotrophica TaxID=2843197 RepID=UPI001C120A00|nr:terminase small subunit [Geomonas diazotrophica]MBU5635899.1 terminase small subunit [Geomonas diazotrophica]